jgi:hypothetical protein
LAEARLTFGQHFFGSQAGMKTLYQFLSKQELGILRISALGHSVSAIRDQPTD